MYLVWFWFYDTELKTTLSWLDILIALISVPGYSTENCSLYLLIFIGLLTLYIETGPVVFLGWFPVKGRGASGVVWTVLDAALLSWKLFPVFCFGVSRLGVSETPNMWDLVLPPLPALLGRTRRPLGGLWWREVDVPVTDRSGWELLCQKLIVTVAHLQTSTV